MNLTNGLRVRDNDLGYCYDVLRAGSRSFHAASLLLPRRVRRSLAPLYAFCRMADDVIDIDGATEDNLKRLHDRLDRIYENEPTDSPIDRAFASVVHDHRIPREIPGALLEGFRWEVEGRRYHSLSDVMSYSARVASTVGVMVTIIVGRRDRATLARACELGLAMQLTNISRDVGEDARAGRIYLPTSWLREEGLDPDEWLANPDPHPVVARSVRRLLGAAGALYRQAETGIGALPRAARPAIWAARLIYAEIGNVIEENDFDGVTSRAITSGWAKMRLATQAALRAWTPGESYVSVEEPCAEIAFLVDAVTGPPPKYHGITTLSPPSPPVWTESMHVR